MEAGTAVTGHYSFGGLRRRIEVALEAAEGPPTVESLAPVDEFHLGGRAATANLAEQLDLSPTSRVVDIGCGLGGAARLVADRYGAAVTGIDLTEEYVEVGTWLTDLVGLADRVHLRVGSALDLPFDDRAFDVATMIHVGMNIAEKGRLFGGVRRCLEPAGVLAIYDIMSLSGGELRYPVPWAAGPETSAVATADDYVEHLAAAGFEIVSIENRLAHIAGPAPVSAGPDRLGLHLVMGPGAGERMTNLGANLRDGLVAPTEIVARATGR